MNRIKQLNDNVINQIAAGEVVERPASVAKELIENSIDAGATKIEVEVANGGRNIRVSDNGSGIYPDDVKLAFSRHATSKILEEKDLWTLNSLGFRGEALASILSIARVTCTTKTKDSENGIKAVGLENGDIEITPCGCANGTTIDIKDLFYNVPARLKFLRKPNTEISAIVDVIQNLAIAHPEVAFVCKNQNKIALKTSGSNDLNICISEIISKDIQNNLLVVNAIDEKEKYFASGVITDPTFTKPNRQNYYIIINGRFVKCPIITKSVDRAYESKIVPGKYPLVVLNLLIPPDKIDVNVHPTKKEVKYTAPNDMFSFVHFAVKKALEDGEFINKPAPAPAALEVQSIEIKEQKAEVEIKEIKPVSRPVIIDKPKQELPKHSFSRPAEKVATSVELNKAAMEFNKPLEQDVRKPLPVQVEASEQLVIKTIADKQIEKEEKNWKVIGQVFNTYIILQAPDEIKIIDQHIASERTIYDQLKKKDHKIAGQRLLIFDEINVTLHQLALLEEYKDQLTRLAFEIEKTGDNTIALKQVPQMLSGQNHHDIFDEIINILENRDSLETPEDNILKTISCHAAVRAGDILSIKEMDLIIEQWQKSDYPYTCPHGRTVCHNISHKELAGYFGRQK